jgi:thiol-disulfide isomerase/thioredoxin
MKTLYCGILFLLFADAAQTQGIEFIKGTWNEALELAKKQGKPLFVDAYAEWCGPCKRMAATTFKDKEVGEFFNKNFVNIKIDCEKEEGLKFRKDYPVTAFPTLYFIGTDGSVIHRAVGALESKEILRLAELALSKIDYSRDFAAKYEAGDRSPQLMFDYVAALNKSGKSSLRIANEYLRTQNDLKSPFNLEFIFEAVTESDSRIFDLLIEHRKSVEELFGNEAVLQKIEYACDKTCSKAVEYKSNELLAEAINKMEKHNPSSAKLFAARSQMRFYLSNGDSKNYLSACNSYYKLRGKNNSAALQQIVQDILNQFNKDASCMKQAEKFAKEAAQTGGSWDYYLTYAEVLLYNGKKREASAAANKSLELAQRDKDIGGEQNAKSFIQQLNAK